MNKEKYYNRMALWVIEKVTLKNLWFNSEGQMDPWNDMTLWNYIKKSNVMDIPMDHVEVYNRVEKILYKKYSAGME
jgi:hypothetical protein